MREAGDTSLGWGRDTWHARGAYMSAQQQQHSSASTPAASISAILDLDDQQRTLIQPSAASASSVIAAAAVYQSIFFSMLLLSFLAASCVSCARTHTGKACISKLVVSMASQVHVRQPHQLYCDVNFAALHGDEWPCRYFSCSFVRTDSLFTTYIAPRTCSNLLPGYK